MQTDSPGRGFRGSVKVKLTQIGKKTSQFIYLTRGHSSLFIYSLLGYKPTAKEGTKDSANNSKIVPIPTVEFFPGFEDLHQALEFFSSHRFLVDRQRPSDNYMVLISSFSTQ